LHASPQVFGVVSIAGAAQRPTPAEAQPSTAPGNLTLAAHTPFTAILKLDGTTAGHGPITFALYDGSADAAAGFTATRGAVQGLKSLPQPAPREPQKSTPSTGHGIPAVAAPQSVAKIVSTVKSLAVSAVYPAPVFSFHA